MALDSPRVWVEFVDPGHRGDPDDAGDLDVGRRRIRADLTWLTSSYRCLFGQGCRGIVASRPDDGCCTLGAQFTDEEDVLRVARVVEELPAEHWQYRSAGRSEGWSEGWSQAQDGERVTRLIDGACILLNRPGFAGGAGCALHRWADRHGRHPLTAKPAVCWQLPLRRSFRTVELPDETVYLETTVAEFDRRGWGPGGHDLNWYCSGDPAAHTATQPVFRSHAAELNELLGAAGYRELARHAQAYLDGTDTLAGSPAGRRARRFLVHPATLAAECSTTE
ncbi:MAG TPA: hypothetical protein VES01_10560 [Dermatophilaceae bacterium]|nr:hypothetical protein [Dermatophilaceae bacterium]